MFDNFDITTPGIKPDHLFSVRLYLSHLYNKPDTISQKDAATLFCVASSNTWARWERGVLEAPPVVLRSIQYALDKEHLLRGLYQSDIQSLQLFLDFHASKQPKPSQLLDPGNATKAGMRRSRLLYQCAWQFGDALSADGFHWHIDEPLALRNPFGGSNKFRSPFVIMLCELLCLEDEPAMSKEDIDNLRQALKVFTSTLKHDECRTVKTSLCDMQLVNNVLTFNIHDAGRFDVLLNRVKDAGMQALIDYTDEMSAIDLLQQASRLLVPLDEGSTNAHLLRDFLRTDGRVKFLPLSQLDAAFHQLSGMPLPSPERSLGHQAWKAMFKGGNEIEWKWGLVTMVGRDMRFTLNPQGQALLAQLRNAA